MLFDFLAQLTKRATLATAAYYNLTFSMLSTFPVLLTGILAWQWALDGQKLKGILLLHLLLGCASSVMICLTWWTHWNARRNGSAALPGYRFAMEIAAAVIVALTGHLGGYLSGVNI